MAPNCTDRFEVPPEQTLLTELVIVGAVGFAKTVIVVVAMPLLHPPTVVAVNWIALVWVIAAVMLLPLVLLRPGEP